MNTPVNPVPAGYHTVTPYMIVGDVAAALAFYRQAFGAAENSRNTDETGSIRHAEIQIGSSRIMLAPEFEMPYVNARSPASAGSACMHIYLYVENVDAFVSRALEAGAKLVMEIKDQYYGDRSGGVVDPFGHIWWVASRVEEVSPEEMARRAKDVKQDC